MTRFAAIGCAVLALDGGEHASENAEAAFSSLIVPALALVRVGSELPGIDPARVYTWGEGLGGALAFAVAAIMPDRIARCAACNPMPLDFTRGSSAVNLVAWAPRVPCCSERACATKSPPRRRASGSRIARAGTRSSSRTPSMHMNVSTNLKIRC